MALQENSGVSEEQIKDVAISVNKHLEGRCKFCPRGFETGEQVVFGSIKTIQMAMLEANVETAEPAGVGERHVIDIINAHLQCAIDNSHKLRSVLVPRKIV